MAKKQQKKQNKKYKNKNKMCRGGGDQSSLFALSDL